MYSSTLFYIIIPFLKSEQYDTVSFVVFDAMFISATNEMEAKASPLKPKDWISFKSLKF